MSVHASAVLDVKRLTASAQDDLVRRLFPVHDEIFAGSSEEDFHRYLVKELPVSTRVQVLEDGDEVVGYGIMHVNELELLGRKTLVMRGGIGLKRAHRGSGLISQFAAVELTRIRAMYPTWPAYGLNFTVHPSSYAVVTRYITDFAPGPDRAPTETEEALIRDIVGQLGMTLVNPDDPWIVDAHWITRLTPEERAYWSSSRKPLVQYYVSRNPGFVHGHGLVVLNPISATGLLAGVGRVGWRQVSRQLTRAGAALQRAGIGTGIDADKARVMLAGAPMLGGASPEFLDRLTAAATTRTIPAGQRLMRAGEPPSELFVIEEGVADVLVGPEELLVDSLEAGEVVGEIGVLLERPRTATLRAGTDLTVLSVPAAAVHAALSAEPELRARLLRVCATRVGEDLVRQSRRSIDLHQGVFWEIAAGDELDLGEGWTVLMAGTAAIEGETTFTLASAPALCRSGMVRAVTPVMMLVVPAATGAIRA